MLRTFEERFETHKPIDSSLSSYIAYYYFNTSKDKKYTKRYFFYPHYRNSITIYKQGKISFKPYQSFVKPYKDKPYEIIYTGVNDFCRYGEITAPFDKIGVVFQPLGVNHFLKVPLSRIQTESAKGDFSAFGGAFDQVLDRVYEIEDLEIKVQLLDDFFLTQLHRELDPRLVRAVDLMFEKDCLVAEVAEEIGVSRKTLQRLFQTHLNCSPKTYLNIIKFRRAVAIYYEKRTSLTELAYENAYYDQSDFIKHFKKVTGFNPKRFFSSLSHIGEEDTFWTELSEKSAVPFLQF